MKRSRKDTAITSGAITPKDPHCLRGLGGKYGRWEKILRDIIWGGLRIVQNRTKSESDTEDDDDDEEEEMPKGIGNRMYDTSEREGEL